MVLGNGHWAGFMKQKQAQVKEKKEAPLDSKQAGWCNYQNFQLIKNEV